MGDVFLEERVRQPPRPAQRVLVVSGCMLLALVAALLPLKTGSVVVAVLGLAAVALVARSLLKRQNREFEYVFTNGSLDIDVIYNKEWRRQLYSLDVREDVEIMAPVGGGRFESAGAQAGEPRNVGTGTAGPGSYFLLLRGREGRGKSVLVWDPSARMVQACRTWAPRTVFTDDPDGTAG